MERTFSMIKPDGTRRNLVGKIIAQLEAGGLELVGMKLRTLSRKDAEGFYAEHKERPFYGELCDQMSKGKVVLMVLQGKDAVKKTRDLMGATNPAQAAEGTVRKLHALSIGENTIHGSDSQESAKREIGYFFPEIELFLN